MKIQTKIALSAIALVLVAQHQLGRYMFERECRTNEGAWAKPIEPADSLAYDILDARHRTGFDVTDSGSLINDEGRRAFVEYYIYESGIESLSTEPGWHRYWLARRGDPACAAFEAATSLHARWRANLTAPHAKPPYLDPNAVCIASRKIVSPESRYLQEVRRYVDWRALGLGVTSYKIVDRHGGDVRIHLQKTTYFGPWIYEMLDWLAGHLTDGGLSHEYCALVAERYAFPTEAYRGPLSTLGPLSSEGWPMLPSTNSSK